MTPPDGRYHLQLHNSTEAKVKSTSQSTNAFVSMDKAGWWSKITVTELEGESKGMRKVMPESEG